MFLKDLLVKTRLDEEIVSEHIVFDINEAIAELEEAIAELEELQQPKSCEGCKWNDIPFPSNQFHCDECKHAYSCYNDNFEPKEV